MKKLQTFFSTRKVFWHRLGNACMVVLCLFAFVTQQTSALSPEQRKLFRQKINKFDIATCGTSESSTDPSVTPGDGEPTGLTFPNLDPSAMANAINKYIDKTNSSSKMKNLGATIVASAKNSNISPFIIVAIAQQESGLSSPTDYNVSNGSNSFGRTAASDQPSFQGARTWYYWPSVKASVDYTDKSNKGINGGGDEASYLVNVYGDSIKKNDLPGLVMAYDPAPEEYNIYIPDVTGWIKEMAALAQKMGRSTAGSTSNSDSTAPSPATAAAEGCCPTSGDTSATTDVSGDPVAKFLQALAFQESGGAVTATSGTGAQGKFQYIDSTWQSSAQSYYPPASKYSSANSAPEAVQDAVAYLEYTVKYAKYKGDFTKMALSHFYPAAIDNPSLLDVTPPGNVITPRQYAASVIKHMKNDDGKSIVFKYEQAPDFDKWLEKAGGAPDASAATSSSGSSSASACGCAAQGAVTDGDAIVLDPGHSPDTDPNGRDPVTGLYVQDYENDPEMANAFTAATNIEKKLKAKGYTVVMTKKSADEKLDLGERARRINAAHGALVVTLHSSPGEKGELMYPDKSSHRTPAGSSRKDGTDGLVHPGIEAPSQKAAETMAPIVAKGIGQPAYTAKSFNERYGSDGLIGNGKNSGNTPVQTILTAIPAVYSEVDQSVLPSDKFADSMAEAIEKMVPSSGGSATASAGGTDASATDSSASSSDASGCAASGSIDSAVQLAMQYGWPDGVHGAAQEPAYKAAIKQSIAKGWYIGGGVTPGNDCGGFVTTVMRNSADPHYNEAGGPTSTQEAYMKSHPDLYQSLGTQSNTSKLQPGDIAITGEHTFMYVGKQPHWNGDTASASLPDRSPNASNVEFSDINGTAYTWYRFIGGS